MSAKDAQKRRSQLRAAKKRAKSRPGVRRQAEMTSEGFRWLAAPVASSVAKKLDLPVEEIAKAMEQMAEEGCLGVDAQGDLVAIRPATD